MNFSIKALILTFSGCVLNAEAHSTSHSIQGAAAARMVALLEQVNPGIPAADLEIDGQGPWISIPELSCYLTEYFFDVCETPGVRTYFSGPTQSEKVGAVMDILQDALIEQGVRIETYGSIKVQNLKVWRHPIPLIRFDYNGE